MSAILSNLRNTILVSFILAIIFKNKGPIRKKYDWELEEENQDLDIQYHYKE